MINEGNLITWWNLPICWLCAILCLPIGIFFWFIYIFPSLFNKREKFSTMNHSAVFAPGFYLGLIISMLIFLPFILLFNAIKNKLKGRV